MVDKRSILYKRTPTGARVEIVRDRPGAAMVGVQALTKHPLLGRVSCVQEHPPATRLGSSEIGDGRALRLVGRRERGGRTATLCVEVYRNSLAESSDPLGRVHPPASPHLGDVVFLMLFFPSRTGEKREAVASTPSWGRRLCPQTLPVNSPRVWSVDQGRDEGLFVSPSHHPLHDYRFERKRCEKKQTGFGSLVPLLDAAWSTAVLLHNIVLIVIWLILPVVIRSSQRLSHACLSITLYTGKLRMAHYISYSLFDSTLLLG